MAKFKMGDDVIYVWSDNQYRARVVDVAACGPTTAYGIRIECSGRLMTCAEGDLLDANDVIPGPMMAMKMNDGSLQRIGGWKEDGISQ